MDNTEYLDVPLELRSKHGLIDDIKRLQAEVQELEEKEYIYKKTIYGDFIEITQLENKICALEQENAKLKESK